MVDSIARLVLIACLLCLARWGMAAALQVTVAQHDVELGQPIWITLRSDQTAVSLNTLDLRPWRDRVALPRAFDANISDDNRSQTLRLRVYPLHKGKLVLPGLHFLSHTSPALRMNVVNATDRKRHSPIDFHCRVSSTNPWQQQQVVVACEVSMDNTHAVLRQPVRQANAAQVLPMQQRAIRQAGQTVYQLGWVLIPTHAGKHIVRLPPIQYVQDGVVSHQFYLPAIRLDVQARPVWLPGTVPVGRVQLAQYGLVDTWLRSARLSHLHLQLRVEGMTTAMIPDYPQQLHSDASLQFYAPGRTLHTTIDHAGLHHDLRYDVPLAAKQVGIYRLPDLRVQYFDPDSGKLKTITIRGPSVVIVNAWLQGLLLLVGLACLGWLLRGILRWWRRVWRRYRAYQSALRLLPQSHNVPAIRQVMRVMAQAEGVSVNFSWQQWQSRMQTLTALAQHVPVRALDAACYGHAELDFVPLAQALARICRQRRFALR